MEKQAKEIWVYCWSDGDSWSLTSVSLLAKAREMVGNSSNWRVCSLLFTAKTNVALSQLAMGWDHLYVFQGASLAIPDHLLFADLLTPLIQEKQPEILLLPVENFTSVLGATLGARMKTGTIAHAVDVSLAENGNLTAKIPAYGGEYLGDIICPHHRPQICCVRVPAQPLTQNMTAGTFSVTPVDDKRNAVSYCLGSATIAQTHDKIEEAKLIICGGRGVGSSENWQILEEVAGLLGGTVACTRAPIDEGWAAGEHMMIGTSGKYVAPQVYLGFGVSGMAHHTCGIQEAGTVFQINNDKNALSLSQADYAIPADVELFLPVLRDAIQQRRNEK
ncbi:MAG: electron transfer flavoprotein subunit alpha/FixB family protein [Bacillota bacterium]|nr:electron transfer flavoprotein subunit alpha/FixB family protein [Bacillota bacterium]